MDVHNSVKHSRVRMSPNEAMNPDQWSSLKMKQFEERVQKYKHYCKLKVNKKFKEGDEVFVQVDIFEDKQAPKYVLGGIITKVYRNDSYELILNDKKIKRYASKSRVT